MQKRKVLLLSAVIVLSLALTGILVSSSPIEDTGETEDTEETCELDDPDNRT